MNFKAWRWIIAAAMLMAVIAIGLIGSLRKRGVTPVSEQEEIAAAETLLARKLSGARYFNAPVAGIREEGGPWISVTDARSQAPKIAAERKLGPEGLREIGRLIGQLTESHPSRVVGGERINLLRLNLSLDSIKE